MHIRFYSSVGGGPLAMLTRSLRSTEATATLMHRWTPSAWRARMAGSSTTRALTRLQTFAGYPLQVVIDAIVSDADALVPSTNPFFLPPLLVATRPLHGRPVVALLYDLYPDAVEVVRPEVGGTSLAGLAVALNRWWIRHADAVVYIGPRMAEHARQRYGAPKRFEIIETGASTEELRVAARAPAVPTSLDKWCEGKTLLSYVGNMGLVHDVDTLARAVKQMIDDPSIERDWGIVVAASGPGADELRRAWTGLPGNRIRFEGPLDDAQWARLLKQTDVSLATLKTAARHTSIPNKTFSAMAAGAAIVAVAPPESDLSGLVTKHHCGYVLEPGDITGLRRALTHLLTHHDSIAQASANSFAAISSDYDGPILAQRWHALFDTLNTESHRDSVHYRLVKRCVDVAVSATTLGATAPLWLSAAAATAITSKGPAFFTQERPGRKNRPFKLVKLRTMRTATAKELGPETDGVRLTRLGAFLRKTSIDELPTLFNVLKGDMSLVGPRPLLTRYLDRYTERQARRHEVLPGITGWAQINGRNASSWETRFEHDVWYVENRSILLDARILAKTLLSVLRHDDIAETGHATKREFNPRTGS